MFFLLVVVAHHNGNPHSEREHYTRTGSAPPLKFPRKSIPDLSECALMLCWETASGGIQARARPDYLIYH